MEKENNMKTLAHCCKASDQRKKGDKELTDKEDKAFNANRFINKIKIPLHSFLIFLLIFTAL